MKLRILFVVALMSFCQSVHADPGCSAVVANQLYKKGALVLLAIDACQEQVFTKLGLSKYSADEITSDRAAYQKSQLDASNLGNSAKEKLVQFVAVRDQKRDAYLKSENAARKKLGLKELSADDIFQDGETADQLAKQIVVAAVANKTLANPDAPMNIGYPRSGMGMNSNAWFCNAEMKLYFEVNDEEPGKEAVPAALGFKLCHPAEGQARMNQTYEFVNDRGYDFFSVCEIQGKKMRCDQAPYSF